MATGMTGLLPSHLFYIMDNPTAYKILVDTEEEVSVLPPECKHREQGYNLLAVNGSSIATFGRRSLTLNLGLRCTFRWVYIIADIKSPIIGVDFLRHCSSLVDAVW